jgi:hypothetical protein
VIGSLWGRGWIQLRSIEVGRWRIKNISFKKYTMSVCLSINQLNQELQAKANIVRDKERKLMEI